MALRPTDIQIILQVSRSIERMQELQQQYSRQQQEQLAAYMQKNLEEKKKQTEPLPKTAPVQIRRISSEDKRKPQQETARRRDKKTGEGDHIDVIV